jgi:hypothetical protein
MEVKYTELRNMPKINKDEGIRFSLLYLERLTPVQDSERFRNRLAAYYEQYLVEWYRDAIVKDIQREIGAKIPIIPGGYSVARFFTDNELRDVLDSVTLIYQVLARDDFPTQDKRWKDFIARVFKEEHLGYQLDSKGGVHYFVDEEFERNRFSTLSSLNSPEYGGIRAAYEDAYRHMDSVPKDTKAAVRAIFEAIEILVKQMVATKNLNKWAVEHTLKEKCLPLYVTNETSKKTVSGLFDGFALWVDCLHNYRHGQPDDIPVAPSEDMTVYILSSGSAFLRWLIGMDKRLRA